MCCTHRMAACKLNRRNVAVWRAISCAKFRIFFHYLDIFRVCQLIPSNHYFPCFLWFCFCIDFHETWQPLCGSLSKIVVSATAININATNLKFVRLNWIDQNYCCCWLDSTLSWRAYHRRRFSSNAIQCEKKRVYCIAPFVRANSGQTHGHICLTRRKHEMFRLRNVLYVVVPLSLSVCMDLRYTQPTNRINEILNWKLTRNDWKMNNTNRGERETKKKMDENREKKNKRNSSKQTLWTIGNPNVWLRHSENEWERGGGRERESNGESTVAMAINAVVMCVHKICMQTCSRSTNGSHSISSLCRTNQQLFRIVVDAAWRNMLTELTNAKQSIEEKTNSKYEN